MDAGGGRLPERIDGDDGRLPERIDGDGGLVLRRWRVRDAERLARAVAESTEHLRPWMAWMADEPLTLEQRREMLAAGEREWRGGGDVLLGVFLDDDVAGSCGLHHRIAPDGLEIGYWIHPRYTRRGLATRAAGLLAQAALALPSVTHVEIHHDRANLASSGVPRKLGFDLVGERRDEIRAPDESGIDWCWRLTAGGSETR
jgi:ribosomal-protein-serine acetyltransferase